MHAADYTKGLESLIHRATLIRPKNLFESLAWPAMKALGRKQKTTEPNLN